MSQLLSLSFERNASRTIMVRARRANMVRRRAADAACDRQASAAPRLSGSFRTSSVRLPAFRMPFSRSAICVVRRPMTLLSFCTLISARELAARPGAAA